MSPARVMDGCRMRVARLGTALALAAFSIGVVSCGSASKDDDSRDSVVSQPPVSAEDFDVDTDSFMADNDIAMTVRSVADAINVGERIDSIDYSFKGVLTDGSGMPLFTDTEGFPGEWEVEVLSSSVVRIRNVNTGDLMPEDLVEYLSAALQLDDDDSLQLVSERHSGESRVKVFSFGRGTITIESRAGEDSTGEAGELMQITMHAAAPPHVPADSIDASGPALPAPDTGALRGTTAKDRSQHHGASGAISPARRNITRR